MGATLQVLDPTGSHQVARPVQIERRMLYSVFTLAIVGFLLTMAVAFALSMRRQRPDDSDAVPVMIVDDDRWVSASHLERRSSDRDPRGTAGSHP